MDRWKKEERSRMFSKNEWEKDGGNEMDDVRWRNGAERDDSARDVLK
jgi:hypothetical protein